MPVLYLIQSIYVYSIYLSMCILSIYVYSIYLSMCILSIYVYSMIAIATTQKLYYTA
jgi:hypothetical protein